MKNMQLRRIKRNSEQGAALVMALMIMLIFIIISTSLLFRWSYDVNRSKIEEKRLQAFYIARSGADALGTYIENNPEMLSNADLKTLVDNLVDDGGSGNISNPVSMGDGSYILQVKRRSDNRSLIEIISTATVDNVYQSVTLVLQEKEIPDTNPDGTVYYSYTWSFYRWEFKPLTP